ncbi:hypothetical protein CYMTET_23667 [Cymbomonas tetramitiformis]|uniref:Serine aminopeptidase S33 domain-containing protein n=1 Tax=Cymbomonas tetramitiformis TaxID=36881 RepID=A0AAE0L0W2_9CHLO|nr:hypothetical protein CYMTET_23667 [Cymbomonas tetramitiformis]
MQEGLPTTKKMAFSRALLCFRFLILALLVKSFSCRSLAESSSTASFKELSTRTAFEESSYSDTSPHVSTFDRSEVKISESASNISSEELSNGTAFEESSLSDTSPHISTYKRFKDGNFSAKDDLEIPTNDGNLKEMPRTSGLSFRTSKKLMQAQDCDNYDPELNNFFIQGCVLNCAPGLCTSSCCLFVWQKAVDLCMLPYLTGPGTAYLDVADNWMNSCGVSAEYRGSGSIPEDILEELQRNATVIEGDHTTFDNVYLDEEAESWYTLLEETGFAGYEALYEPLQPQYTRHEFLVQLCNSVNTTAEILVPTAIPKAILTFVHGRGESLLKYDAILQKLIIGGESWVIILYDQRGQGRGGGPTNHYESFDDGSCDLEMLMKSMIRTEWRQLPVYALGHSTGGGILARYMQIYPNRLSAAVLSSPLVSQKDAYGISAEEQCELAKEIIMSQPSRTLQRAYSFEAPLSFERQTLTNSRQMYETYELDPVRAACMDYGPPTYGWIAAACDVTMDLFKDPDSMSSPWWLVSASNDTVIDTEAAVALCAMSDSCKGSTILEEVVIVQQRSVLSLDEKILGMEE